MEVAAINKEQYTIQQGYEYLGDEYWEWWVWVNATPKALDKIDFVTYILHPTFTNPIKEVRDRTTNFKLKTSGWGTFTLRVKLHLKTGEVLQLQHQLELEYPDDGWELLSEIKVKTGPDEKVIQLLQGDLSAIPKKHATDILVISAYPRDYRPLEGTLIEALQNKGISVARMAADKEIDLSERLNCWLSKPLNGTQQEQFNFKRLLCFEPPVNTNIDVSVVGNIFRCLNTFAFDVDNRVICLPLLAGGSRNIPVKVIVPAILDATIFWLEKGMPLQFIKLVVYTEDEAAAALPLFEAVKEQYGLKDSVKSGKITSAQAIDVINKEYKTKGGFDNLPIIESEIKQLSIKAPAVFNSSINSITSNSKAVYKYDFYISHAKQDAAAVKIFVDALLAIDSSLNIFYDNTSLPAGALWIKHLSDTIEDARNFIAILSPEYNTSAYCWDEFQCAKTFEYPRSSQTFIKTIYYKSDANMPSMFSMYSYIDCREADIDKLKNAAKYFIYK